MLEATTSSESSVGPSEPTENPGGGEAPDTPTEDETLPTDPPESSGGGGY